MTTTRYLSIFAFCLLAVPAVAQHRGGGMAAGAPGAGRANASGIPSRVPFVNIPNSYFGGVFRSERNGFSGIGAFGNGLYGAGYIYPTFGYPSLGFGSASPFYFPGSAAPDSSPNVTVIYAAPPAQIGRAHV